MDAGQSPASCLIPCRQPAVDSVQFVLAESVVGGYKIMLST